MNERHHRDERTHQRIWELLPWYVNGTLLDAEREKVEEHLAGCSRCRAETETCRRTAQALRNLGEVAPSPHPVQFQRVLARLGEAEAAGREHHGRRRRAGSFLQAGPRPLWMALAAQAAVILVLAGMLVWDRLHTVPDTAPNTTSNIAPASPPAVYRTLSDPAPQPDPGAARLRVMFSPGATEKEIRALLGAVRGEIKAGPSPMGLYTVEVPAGSDPLSVVLVRLRSEPQVTFAEPAAGEGGAP